MGFSVLHEAVAGAVFRLLLVLYVVGCRAQANHQHRTYELDRKALLVFYDEIRNKELLDWDPASDPCGNRNCYFRDRQSPSFAEPEFYPEFVGALPCNWSGVQCANWRIIDLNLSCPDPWIIQSGCDQPLHGRLTDSIGDLTKLRSIDLSNNQLTGTLPASWSNLRDLTQLDLGRNSISGTLPDAWGSLYQLIMLALDHNVLTGELPDSWEHMFNLWRLALHRNMLEGDLPASWAAMQQLKAGNFALNELTGSIPPVWSKLRMLDHLIFTENCGLCGDIPIFASPGVQVYIQGTNLGRPCRSNSCSHVFPLGVVLPGVIVGCVLCLLLILAILLHIVLKHRRMQRMMTATSAELNAAPRESAHPVSSYESSTSHHHRRAVKWRDYAKLVIQPDYTVAFGVILKPAVTLDEKDASGDAGDKSAGDSADQGSHEAPADACEWSRRVLEAQQVGNAIELAERGEMPPRQFSLSPDDSPFHDDTAAPHISAEITPVETHDCVPLSVLWAGQLSGHMSRPDSTSTPLPRDPHAPSTRHDGSLRSSRRSRRKKRRTSSSDRTASNTAASTRPQQPGSLVAYDDVSGADAGDSHGPQASVAAEGSRLEGTGQGPVDGGDAPGPSETSSGGVADAAPEPGKSELRSKKSWGVTTSETGEKLFLVPAGELFGSRRNIDHMIGSLTLDENEGEVAVEKRQEVHIQDDKRKGKRPEQFHSRGLTNVAHVRQSQSSGGDSHGPQASVAAEGSRPEGTGQGAVDGGDALGPSETLSGGVADAAPEPGKSEPCPGKSWRVTTSETGQKLYLVPAGELFGSRRNIDHMIGSLALDEDEGEVSVEQMQEVLNQDDKRKGKRPEEFDAQETLHFIGEFDL